jgi:intracellular sulfur oxidation DsrE/DsrF family protein
MLINRRLATALAFSPIALASLATPSGAAEKKPSASRGKTHHVAMHINTSDATLLGQALNNAQNLHQYYSDKGETLELRIVAHGPGLHMLRLDTSPVLERLASMKRAMPHLSLAACANTRRSMEKAEGKEIPVTEMAVIVPSGVVELVGLQERGWSYLRA